MDELLRIEGLRADLVPHRQWAVSRWFYASPIWYYHRASAAHEIDAHGRFYQLVDPQLREVCRVLNDAGLRTTPSCQGHSYPRERFERIWEVLLRERDPIRGQGLVVKDSENQKEYLFQDPRYELAWPSFEEFYGQASAHQNLGYVGIIVPAERQGFADRIRADKYRTVATCVSEDGQLGNVLAGAVFSIFVDAIDPQVRTIEWANFTKYVEAVVTRG